MAKVILPAICLFLLIPSVSNARPHVYAMNGLAVQRDKISDSLNWLPAVADSDWSIFVVPTAEWDARLTKQQRKHAEGSCFSYIEKKLTYCSGEFVAAHTAKKLAQVLAHEYGHILCLCADEAVAEGHVSTLFHVR